MKTRSQMYVRIGLQYTQCVDNRFHNEKIWIIFESKRDDYINDDDDDDDDITFAISTNRILFYVRIELKRAESLVCTIDIISI